MSDKPRDWPNNAKEARDRASEYVAEAIHQLTPLISGESSIEPDRFKHEARALNACLNAARWLESVGACTKPF